MRRRCLGFCLVVLAAPLLVGCASLPAIFLEGLGENVTPEVDESLHAFNQDLRWGRFQQAAAQMPEDQREAFISLFDHEESPFRFTSTEVLSATPKGVEGREVDAVIAWEFYSPPALTERKLRQKQAWRFLPVERRWEVVPDLAPFQAVVAARPQPAVGAVPASPQR